MIFPKIFAHRGANSFAPENTLPAFQKAFELGCDGIELDVRFTADQNIVVFHDRNTFRMTGTKKSIQRLTLKQIQELRIRQEKIPLLEEVLDFAANKFFIILDVKKESLIRNGFEKRLTTILRDFSREANIIISSFNPIVLKRIAALEPAFHFGFIFRNRSSIMMLNGQPVESFHARHKLLSNRYLKHLKSRGASVFAWTVDRREDMIQLISKNVDGIISNQPEMLLEIKNNFAGGPGKDLIKNF